MISNKNSFEHPYSSCYIYFFLFFLAGNQVCVTASLSSKLEVFLEKNLGVVTAKQAQKVSKNHRGDLCHRPKGGIGKNGALPWKLPQESVATKKREETWQSQRERYVFFFGCLESWRMRAKAKKVQAGVQPKHWLKKLEENRTNIYQNGSFGSGPQRCSPNQRFSNLVMTWLANSGIDWTKATNPVSWKPPDWLYNLHLVLASWWTPRCFKLLDLTWKLKRDRKSVV